MERKTRDNDEDLYERGYRALYERGYRALPHLQLLSLKDSLQAEVQRLKFALWAMKYVILVGKYS